MNKEFLGNLKAGDIVVRCYFAALVGDKKRLARVKRITKTQIIIEFKYCNDGVLIIEKYRKLDGTIIKKRGKTALERVGESQEWLEEYKATI